MEPSKLKPQKNTNLFSNQKTAITHTMGTWNPKQPFIKWMFQLDDSKSLHRKWLFHHFHPFINGCLGFQVDVARSKFKDIVSKTNIQRSPALADWVAISGVWTPKRKRLSLENLLIARSSNGERIAIMGGR